MNRLFKIVKELFPYTTKNWSVFILCIVISAIFWLFLTFSGRFESEIVLKVNYLDFPKNKVLINEPLKEIRIKVKARGFDLLKHSWIKKSSEIELSSEDFDFKQAGTLFNYYLSVGKQKNILQNKLPQSFEIITFPIEKMVLSYDDVVSKKVKVKPVYKVVNDTNLFQLSSPNFSLDSVEITGSKTMLQNISNLETEQIEIGQIKSKTSIFLPIRRAKGVIDMLPDSIQMHISVEAIQQYSLLVPIKCNDCPLNRQLKLFPSEANVIFSCTEKEFKNINPSDFELHVNYSEVNADSEKLFIQLFGSPKRARNIKVSPAKAEYLIRE